VAGLNGTGRVGDDLWLMAQTYVQPRALGLGLAGAAGRKGFRAEMEELRERIRGLGLGCASGPDSGASQTPSGSAPVLRWLRVFPGEESQLGLVRRWLVLLFPPCPARDDVTTIASELSANALRHTTSGRGGLFSVGVTWYGPVVRVTVADGGAATGPRVIDDPAAEHGRGLLVVRELSVHMGVCGDGSGRLVWADVGWDCSPGVLEPVEGES
jgi:anti-sigma regulatory factor (Ser/Thr protein kinase)